MHHSVFELHAFAPARVHNTPPFSASPRRPAHSAHTLVMCTPAQAAKLMVGSMLSNVHFLVLGGFTIASALSRYELDVRLASVLLRPKCQYPPSRFSRPPPPSPSSSASSARELLYPQDCTPSRCLVLVLLPDGVTLRAACLLLCAVDRQFPFWFTQSFRFLSSSIPPAWSIRSLVKSWHLKPPHAPTPPPNDRMWCAKQVGTCSPCPPKLRGEDEASTLTPEPYSKIVSCHILTF